MRRLTADGAIVLPLHAMLTHVYGGKGWLEKCLVESPLVRQVSDPPLLSWCTFWDNVKALGACRMEQMCFHCMQDPWCVFVISGTLSSVKACIG